MNFVSKPINYQSSGYERLHKLNVFRNNPPDFKSLALKYPITFGKAVRHNVRNDTYWLDWKDSAAVQCYTKTILEEYFQLKDITLEDERLCPAIPNRLNYICWIHDLLGTIPTAVGQLQNDSTSRSRQPTDIDSALHATGRVVCGLDIGVGGSCIYPLLGCTFNSSIQLTQIQTQSNESLSSRCCNGTTGGGNGGNSGNSGGGYHWTFVGSDIDPQAVKLAQLNAMKNDLSDRIAVTLVPPSLTLQQLIIDHLTLPGFVAPSSSSSSSSAAACSRSVGALVYDFSSERVENLLQAVKRNIAAVEAAAAAGCGGDSIAVARGPVREFICAAARSGDDSSCSSITSDSNRWDEVLFDLEHRFAHSCRDGGGSCPDSSIEIIPAPPGHPQQPPPSSSSLASSSQPSGGTGAAKPLKLQFCMTNPPFYALEEQEGVQAHPNPHTVCTGNNSEMFTPGGEIAFIASIIVDSLVLRESVQWYTAMCGKKTTLASCVKFIYKLNRLYPNEAPVWIHTYPFIQGSTTRWGLAWSYTSTLATPSPTLGIGKTTGADSVDTDGPENNGEMAGVRVCRVSEVYNHHNSRGDSNGQSNNSSHCTARTDRKEVNGTDVASVASAVNGGSGGVSFELTASEFLRTMLPAENIDNIDDVSNVNGSSSGGNVNINSTCSAPSAAWLRRLAVSRFATAARGVVVKCCCRSDHDSNLAGGDVDRMETCLPLICSFSDPLLAASDSDANANANVGVGVGSDSNSNNLDSCSDVEIVGMCYVALTAATAVTVDDTNPDHTASIITAGNSDSIIISSRKTSCRFVPCELSGNALVLGINQFQFQDKKQEQEQGQEYGWEQQPARKRARVACHHVVLMEFKLKVDVVTTLVPIVGVGSDMSNSDSSNVGDNNNGSGCVDDVDEDGADKVTDATASSVNTRIRISVVMVHSDHREEEDNNVTAGTTTTTAATTTATTTTVATTAANSTAVAAMASALDTHNSCHFTLKPTLTLPSTTTTTTTTTVITAAATELFIAPIQRKKVFYYVMDKIKADFLRINRKWRKSLQTT